MKEREHRECVLARAYWFNVNVAVNVTYLYHEDNTWAWRDFTIRTWPDEIVEANSFDRLIHLRNNVQWFMWFMIRKVTKVWVQAMKAVHDMKLKHETWKTVLILLSIQRVQYQPHTQQNVYILHNMWENNEFLVRRWLHTNAKHFSRRRMKKEEGKEWK